MKIIVNDTNILIDLIKINLLDTFLNLEFVFHTNDFIINEINNIEQKNKIEQLISNGKLIVNKTEAEEYAQIYSMQIKNLSFEDCSIWHYAKKINGILLTGDARLRKEVEKTDIEVRGILFVFDKLIECFAIEKSTAINKLNELYSFNIRLPKNEIDKRIEAWQE